MKRTTIVADENVMYKVSRIAEYEGVSSSAIVREAIAEYVIRYEQKNPPENPLLALIGLCADGDTGEPFDLSDGQDEAFIIATIDPERGFAG